MTRKIGIEIKIPLKIYDIIFANLSKKILYFIIENK
jgi:hypothetical protein